MRRVRILLSLPREWVSVPIKSFSLVSADLCLKCWRRPLFLTNTNKAPEGEEKGGGGEHNSFFVVIQNVLFGLQQRKNLCLNA